MKSYIGEFYFGLGIAIFGGSIVLLWDKISSFFPDLIFLYISILIIVAISLIIVGAKRINKYLNKK